MQRMTQFDRPDSRSFTWIEPVIDVNPNNVKYILNQKADGSHLALDLNLPGPR